LSVAIALNGPNGLPLSSGAGIWPRGVVRMSARLILPRKEPISEVSDLARAQLRTPAALRSTPVAGRPSLLCTRWVGRLSVVRTQTHPPMPIIAPPDCGGRGADIGRPVPSQLELGSSPGNFRLPRMTSGLPTYCLCDDEVNKKQKDRARGEGRSFRVPISS
jgi:hypothetical protein